MLNRSLSIASIVIAVLALCLGGALASGVIITSKQIKNGTILSQDIHNNQVQSADLKNQTVNTQDIANNAVEAPQIEVPQPKQLEQEGAAVGNVEEAFGLVDSVGTYVKEEAETALQVEWIGSAEGGLFGSCIFQLRVDGVPAPGGGSEWFIQNQQRGNVAMSDIFPSLPVGPHRIEVWARVGGSHMGNGPFPCIVGPASMGIGQTFLVGEVVL
jgi:hypothetical protein